MTEAENKKIQENCNFKDCKSCKHFLISNNKPTCTHTGVYNLDCILIVASGNSFDNKQ